MKRHGGTFGGTIGNKKTWAALALLAAVGYPMAARGQNILYTWDSSGANPAHPVDGGGNWSTSVADWTTNGGSDVVWPNNPNDVAVFGDGGTAGTVTLTTPILASGVQFNPVSSGTYTIAGSATDNLTMLSITADANGNISAPIAGSAGLTVNGTDVVNLSGANTYTGNTVINGATLQLGATNTLPATTAVTVNSGGTLDTDSETQTIASLAGSGNLLLESGSNLTLNQSTNTTFSGQISGSGTLTKLLAGALALNAAEPNFTGTVALTGTAVNELALSGNANINNANLVVISNGPQTGSGPMVTLSNLATAFSVPITETPNLGDYRFTIDSIAGNNTVTSPITINFPSGGASQSFVFEGSGRKMTVSSNITVPGSSAGGQIVFRGTNVTQIFTGKITTSSNAVVVATTDPGMLYFEPQPGGNWGYTSASANYTVAINSDSAIAGSTIAGASNGFYFGGGHVEFDGYTSNLNFVQANINGATTALMLGAGIVDANGNAVGPSTYAGTISLTGTNAIDFVGPGMLNFTGQINYSGTTAGTVTFSTSGSLDGAINYTAKNGSGNPVAVSGGLTISAGTTQFGPSGSLPAPVGGAGGAAVSISAGATLDLNDTYQIAKSLAGAGNLLLTGSASELDLDTSTGTFSGNISGAGSFDIVGGTLTLSGNNTFTGQTYVGGTLTVGSATAISAGSDVFLSNGTLAIGTFSPTLGSLSSIGGTVTGSGNLTVGADNNSEVFGGKISTTGSVTLIGTGTWNLANNSTYTGATNINSGTLQLGTNNALPTTTAVNIAAAGTFDMNGGSQQVASLSGAGNILLSGQLTVGGTNASSTFSGTSSGGGSLIVAEGTGTLNLTGSNSYTGGTQLNSGTLAINSDSAINTSQVSFGGGTLQFLNYTSNASFNGVSGLSLGAAAGAASTLAGAITGGNGLTYAGPGTLILTNTGNNYSGGTNITGGNLQFATGAFPSGTSITINNGGALNLAGAFTTVTGTLPSIATNSTGALALTGDSSENINFTGYNTLALGAAVNSNYTGTITPGGGNYNLGGGGATLTLPNNNALTGSNNLVVGSTGSTGTVALTGTNNFNGTVTLNGPTLEINSDAAINGNVITFAGGTLQLDGYSSNLPAFSNSGGAPVNIAVPASATSTLNSAIPSGAAFNYQGPGTLLLGTNVVLSTTAPLTINAGTLDLNNHSQTVATLAGSGNVMIESGSTLSASSAGSTTFSGNIEGGGAFTRNSTGVFTVTGANAITGPVSITQVGTTASTNLALSGAGSFNSASSLTFTNLVSTGGTNDLNVTLSNLTAPMSVPIDIVTPTTGGDYRVGMSNIAGNNTVTSPTTMNAGENKTNVSTLTYSSSANTVLTISSAVTIPSTNGSNAITTSPVTTNAPTITVDGQLGFRGIGATSSQVVGIFNGSIGGGGASTLLVAKTDPGAWLWEPTNYATNTPSVWGAGSLNMGVGVLQMGEANAMCPTAILELTSGSATANTVVFDLNGYNQTVQGLASTVTGSATITSTNGAATLTLNAPTTGTYIFGGNASDSISGPLTINIAAGGTGTQEFNEPNTYTGGTNLNGGILTIVALSDLGTGPITFNGGTLAYPASNTIDITTGNNVTVGSGGGTINVGANSPTYADPITGTGVLTKTGTTGTLTFNSPLTLGGLTVSGGATHLAAASNTFTGALTTSGATSVVTIDGATTAGTVVINTASTLTLNGGLTAGKLSGDGSGTLKITTGKVAATAQNQTTLNLAALTISPGATLDLGNGNLAVHYGSNTDPLATIVTYIKDGYDGGNWNGTSAINGSIISSASIGHATALGYLDNTTLQQVQVKYTWYGDLNLDGVVNSADLTAMNAGNGSSWSQGDLNYDGVKNADDWSLFMYGDASQNGSIAAGVPEPSGAVLALALPALGLRRRARRD